MNLKEARYYLEHKFLNTFFFEEKSKLIYVLLKKDKDEENVLFGIMKKLCDNDDIMEYQEEEYKISSYSFGDDYKMVILDMPTPRNPLECIQIFLVFDDNFEKMSYITLESSYDDNQFLCSWDKNHNHSNYGDCPKEEKEKIKKVMGIFLSQN